MEKLKLILSKIWKFINSKIFIILIIIGLVLFSALQCSRIREFKRQQLKDKQNEIALKDSLKFEKQKNGELNVSIASYIATEKELKILNEDLWRRVKAQNGEIISLNHSIIMLIQDTTLLRKYLVEKDKLIEKLLKIDENTYAAPWSLSYKYDSTNFDKFSGRTIISISNKNPIELIHVNTELLKRETQIDLTWGQKIENDVLRVYIQSAYPGFTVTQLSGVMIDPNSNADIQKLLKRKHFFQGVGIGPSVTAGWDILHSNPGLVLGVSLHYNIYRW